MNDTNTSHHIDTPQHILSIHHIDTFFQHTHPINTHTHIHTLSVHTISTHPTYRHNQSPHPVIHLIIPLTLLFSSFLHPVQALLKTFVIPTSVPFIPTIADKIVQPTGTVEAPPSPSNQEGGGVITNRSSAGRLSARPVSGLGAANASSMTGGTSEYPVKSI